MTKLTQPLLACAVLLLGGCSFWSGGASTARLSVPLGEPVPATGRSAALQKQVAAMDEAAFGGSKQVSLTLKLSYELSLAPRKT